MADGDYERCRFSITCHTNDLAVVHCLRAICEFAAEGIRPQIGGGGTKASEWRAADNQITLRFASPDSRQRFFETANRLLSSGSWVEVSLSDSDPARRQRAVRT